MEKLFAYLRILRTESGIIVWDLVGGFYPLCWAKRDTLHLYVAITIPNFCNETGLRKM